MTTCKEFYHKVIFVPRSVCKAFVALKNIYENYWLKEMNVSCDSEILYLGLYKYSGNTWSSIELFVLMLF